MSGPPRRVAVADNRQWSALAGEEAAVRGVDGKQAPGGGRAAVTGASERPRAPDFVRGLSGLGAVGGDGPFPTQKTAGLRSPLCETEEGFAPRISWIDAARPLGTRAK